MAKSKVGKTVGSLGDYLREQRQASRLSLRQLAEQAGVSNPYLSQIERGLHEPSGSLTGLWKAVEAHVAPLGFPTENRPFSPHLTLGRVGRQVSTAEAREVGEAVAANASRLASIRDEMDVRTVALIKSDLQPAGPIYTRLFEAELVGQPGS